MTIIDSHQHFWNKDEVHYHWLTPEAGVLYRNVLPAELEKQLNASGVSKTVVVQATSSMEETAWLMRIAEENNFIAGIVVWVDLKDENLPVTLEHIKKCPKVKGVRHQIEDEPNREWILDPAVLRGLCYVRDAGLRFDALLKHDQLWQLEKVCEAAEGLPIVLDHCAKPCIKHGDEPWVQHIRSVSWLPIYVKLSGLFTEAQKPGWETNDIRPYSDIVLEEFDVDRVMFGSDWPISALACDYMQTVEQTISLLNQYDESAKEKLLYKNAVKFYGLSI